MVAALITPEMKMRIAYAAPNLPLLPPPNLHQTKIIP